jgi:thiamine-phosphate pyrophosphorylase
VDVTVAASAGWDPVELARAFLDGGARCVQLRAKGLPANRFLDLCDAVVSEARRYDAIVIVNDRVDLALISEASGVHVGQDDLSPADARELLGPAAVIGYSTHTITQIEEAATQPASYVAVGPVFGTYTKDTGYLAVGLALVKEAVERSRGRPVVAIGGITLETAPDVWAAGASAVAIISDLLQGGDPARRVAGYNRVAPAVPPLEQGSGLRPQAPGLGKVRGLRLP